MPNVVALMNEYAPKKIRSTLVAIMFSGYSVGGMLSAGLGIVLIPSFGWQSVFYVAVLPLLLLPCRSCLKRVCTVDKRSLGNKSPLVVGVGGLN